LVEKVIHDFFNLAIRTPLTRIPALRDIETSCPATWFSNGSHFQWLIAIENGGTSLCRAQPAEKQSFSAGCWLLA
jgi:hypothetical protein